MELRIGARAVRHVPLFPISRTVRPPGKSTPASQHTCSPRTSLQPHGVTDLLEQGVRLEDVRYLAVTVRQGDWRCCHEREQLPSHRQRHQFVDERPVIVGEFPSRRCVGEPCRLAEFAQPVLQRCHFEGSTSIAQPPITLRGAGFAINVQQFIREPAVLDIARVLERQLDRFSQQMRPTLLRRGKVRVHRRIVADHDAFERRGFEDLLQRLSVLVNAEQPDPRFLRDKRPDAVQAPTRFISVDDRGVRQSCAESFEFLFPMSRQLTEQGVDLRFSQQQVLEEAEGQTDFVEGQTGDIDPMSDRDADLLTKFAAIQHAGNLTVLVARAAINLVSDSHRPGVFQSPHGPHRRQPARVLRKTRGKNRLRPFRQRHRFCCPNRTATTSWSLLLALLPTLLLPRLFRSH